MAPKVNLPFRCELCQKSYARISELETHESSYDHHHRKRAVDLRIANRDTGRRQREAEKEGVIRLLDGDTDSHTGKKEKKAKRGFKSAFAAAPEDEGKALDSESSQKRAEHDTNGSRGYKNGAERVDDGIPEPPTKKVAAQVPEAPIQKTYDTSSKSRRPPECRSLAEKGKV